MKLYTARGDQGYTDLHGGKRVSKSEPVIHLVGTMDEFTSELGLARSYIDDDVMVEDIKRIQQDIIGINAQIAGGAKYIDNKKIAAVEGLIDKYQQRAGEFKGFILPGDSKPAAVLDVARTVIRRAERVAVELKEKAEMDPEVLVYINRLSDLVYAAARYIEFKAKIRIIVSRVARDMKENQWEKGLKCNSGLTLDTAKWLAEEIQKKAVEKDVEVVIALADEGGNTILVHRMESAFIASLDIAVNKAYTSVALKMPTTKVGELSKPGSPLYGLQFTNDNRLVIFGGGVPLRLGEKIVGGLGVSGGTAEQDTALAEYGLEVFKGGMNKGDR